MKMRFVKLTCQKETQTHLFVSFWEVYACRCYCFVCNMQQMLSFCKIEHILLLISDVGCFLFVPKVPKYSKKLRLIYGGTSLY